MQNKFTIIAGVNGSGKTTFALDYFTGSDTIFINADSIATSLSPNNPDLSQFRAGKIMLKEIKNSIKNQQSFAIETTLSSKNYLKIIKQLKDDNWQINLIYLYLPSVELSMQRVVERVKNGGHNIKKTDILRRYNRSISNLINDYIEVVDNVICIDNYDNDEIIFSKNSKINIYSQEKYNKIMEFKNA
jgi:predicted ABC-type ATPase